MQSTLHQNVFYIVNNSASLNVTNEGNHTTHARATSPTTYPDLIAEQPYLAGTLICLYIVIWVIGFVGNVMVLHVVIKYKAMRTVTNNFIACLCVSDLAICMFAIPLTPFNAFINSWILGGLLCKLAPFILSTAVFLSTFVSVIIAIDRFVVIIFPHRPKMSTHLQVAIILTSAALSIVFALPSVIYTVLRTNDDGTKSCKEDFPEYASEIYTWFVLSVQLIAPAVILTVCYTSISVKLYRRANARSETRAEHKIKEEALRNRRVNRMLITMVTIFICCWLPLDLIHFFTPFISKDYLIPIFLITHVIAMSSVMYNPILYGWMNEAFNKYFILTVPCLKHLVRPTTKPSKRLTRAATFKQSASLPDMATTKEDNVTLETTCTASHVVNNIPSQQTPLLKTSNLK